MKMTLEEMFCDCYDKYGNDFNWYMLPFAQADGAFVAELNKEIGQDYFLYDKKIRAVAKVNPMMMCYMFSETEWEETFTIWSI